MSNVCFSSSSTSILADYPDSFIDQSLRESPAMDEAVDFLLELLSPPGKLVEHNYIMQEAEQRKISLVTLRRSKKNGHTIYSPNQS